MVCSVEILHIVPLFALVINHFSSLTSTPKNLLASLLSVIGLAGGAHMHIDHGIMHSLFDPCVIYAITFVASIATIVYSTFASEAAK